MRIFVIPCCAAALSLLGPCSGIAQDKSAASKQSQEVQQQTTVTNGNDKSAKVSTDTIRGRIETYEPGKTLKVTVPGKIVQSKSFDLNSKDWTYHVAKGLKAGQWVSIVEKTDNNGHKTLTVSHSSKTTSRTTTE